MSTLKNTTKEKLTNKTKTLKNSNKNNSTTSNNSNNSNNSMNNEDKDYKEEYTDTLKQLKFYNKKYEKDTFKSNSYAKALEGIQSLNEPLTNSSQIKDIPGIGKAMTSKLDELIKTNKVQNLESLKEKHPEGTEEYKKEKIKEMFMQIHGIGDIRAQEIVDLNILTIEELKKRKDEKIRGKKKNLPLLDEKQQKGLIYFEETSERIPRSEIEEFEKLFKKEFIELLNSKDESLENHIFEITGRHTQTHRHTDTHTHTDTQTYPDNKIAQDQHAALTLTKDKVKLPYELWSMDKIKPTTNALEKFKEKYSEPFVISAKLDGISALYTTNEDKPHLYTRGNGKYGQNIDHLIKFLKLPTTKELAIRGELIIKEEVFKAKYSRKI